MCRRTGANCNRVSLWVSGKIAVCVCAHASKRAKGLCGRVLGLES